MNLLQHRGNGKEEPAAGDDGWIVAREWGPLQRELVGLFVCLKGLGQSSGSCHAPSLVSPNSERAKSQRDEAVRKACSWPSVKRSLLIALIVGTTVNAINQGPELLAGQWPVMWKLAFTYLMPFLVASYGSYAALRGSL